MLVCLCSFFLLIGAHKASANHAWAVIDADTGRLLEGSNEHARLPIASLTKIWTALTVLESAEPLEKRQFRLLLQSAKALPFI